MHVLLVPLCCLFQDKTRKLNINKNNRNDGDYIPIHGKLFCNKLPLKELLKELKECLKELKECRKELLKELEECLKESKERLKELSLRWAQYKIVLLRFWSRRRLSIAPEHQAFLQG